MLKQLTYSFKVEERPGGMWRATAPPAVFEFSCPEGWYRITQEGPTGLYVERESRAAAIADILEVWGNRIARIGELAVAGGRPSDYPSTPTPIGGYCAIDPPSSE